MSSSPEPHRPCSKCPVLDIGHRYEKGDPHDPWRRMPALFDAARRLFGNVWFNHGSQTRLGTEKAMRQYCYLQRSRYGLCTMARSRACQGLLQGAIEAAGQGRNRHAMLRHQLVQVVNREETHEAMKATMARPRNVTRLPDVDFDFGRQQDLLD